MKVISLNAYFGVVLDPLLDFVVRESASTDVFCFQEMLSNGKEDVVEFDGRGRANVLQEIARRLPDFEVSFAPMQDGFECSSSYPGQVQMGVAIFYRRGLKVVESGSFFVYNGFNSFDATAENRYETLGHVAVWIGIEGRTPTTILTLHGNSQPSSKLDSPKRLEQSKRILDFLRERPGEKIVMGDFNLFPETESIRLIEREGYRNLVVENKIATTRGSHMRTLFPEYANGPHGFQEFADYAFVSAGIVVTSFDVPDLPISDHLPMILKCDV